MQDICPLCVRFRPVSLRVRVAPVRRGGWQYVAGWQYAALAAGALSTHTTDAEIVISIDAVHRNLAFPIFG
jgi:hypothetical protein